MVLTHRPVTMTDPTPSALSELAVLDGADARAPDLALIRTRPRTVAALALCVLLAIVFGLTMPSSSSSSASLPAPGFTDVQLYRDQVVFARTPSTYYARVMDEQRRRDYPLRPFVTVRQPALAFLLAWLPGGEVTGRILLGVLAVAVAGLWTVRLVNPLGAPGAAVAGLALAGGVVAAFTPNGYLMHDTWAGLLIALSLALYPGDRSRGRSLRLAVSITAAVAAALVRELALPFLGVMALMALVERRPREVLLWFGAIGVCLLALLAHALAVMRHTLPADPGMGWLRLGGWDFVLAANRWNAILALKPWLPAVLIPAALAGALAWRGPTGRRLTLTLLGYVCGFVVIGRPEDFYWGLLIAPLLPIGWVGAVAACLGLASPLVHGGPARWSGRLIGSGPGG
jgi:hypothetical protein